MLHEYRTFKLIHNSLHTNHNFVFLFWLLKYEKYYLDVTKLKCVLLYLGHSTNFWNQELPLKPMNVIGLPHRKTQLGI